MNTTKIINYFSALNDIMFNSGCTVLISLGRSSANRQTIIAKNRDIASISSPEIMVLTKPADGNKYLGIATMEDPSSLTIGINEKGVLANKAGRYCRTSNPEGINSGVIMQIALRSANNAREMVTKVQEIIRTKQQKRRGFAYTCADVEEAYVIEAYKQENEIYGPLKDTVFAYGNYALTDTIRQYEKTTRGHQRAKRAQELLEQYKGDLTVSFLIRFCRDHEFLPDPAYTWDDRNICTHGFGTDTRGSGICKSHRKYPQLLSVVWSAFNQPCKTPYVPFYMGITRLPDVYAGADAYHAFETLAKVLEENPGFKTEVRRYWEAFEFQSVREGSYIEKKVAELADHGQIKEAEEMLTGFVNEKAQRAVDDARKITAKIHHEGLIH